MKVLNNMSYMLEISYINNSGLDTLISLKLYDNGLEIKSVKVGDVCVTEETINERVLSGKFENSDGYCGYKYDYEKGGALLNSNPNIPLETVIQLINKTKMKHDFLSAKLVVSSILRNDYRVVALNKGSLKITKTLSTENEQAHHYSLQEDIDLLKLGGEEYFVEKHKERIYKIDDNCIAEESQLLTDDMKSYLNDLSYIINQNPQNHKVLIALKDKIKKRNNSNANVVGINE